MSKGPRLTKTEIEILASAASMCPGGTAKNHMDKYLELGGRPLSISSIEHKLAEWRKEKKIPPANTSVPKEDRKPGLESPWSLGTLSKPENINMEIASGDLLAVWRYCLAIGHTLTLREAKWVTRLRSVPIVDRERIGLLFQFAHDYALREQVGEILNIPVETKDLDGELGMNPIEHFIYRSLNLIPKRTRIKNLFGTILSKKDQDYHYIQNASFMVWLKHIPKTALFEGENLPIKWGPKDATAALQAALDEKESQVPLEDNPLSFIDITKTYSPEQDRIYAAVLLYLSNGPKWNDLNKEQVLYLLRRLDKWVTTEIPWKEPTRYLIFEHSREEGIVITDIINPELLKMVGYEVTSQTERKYYPQDIIKRRSIHERAHSQKV